MAIEEMLFLKFFNFMSLLQNLCSLATLALFSLDMYPVLDPISKGNTETLNVCMSDSKCWYFLSLMLCAIDILDQGGRIFEISWELSFPVNNFA